ncbi:uncharacterized protein LOC131939008 isoform X2 [Physella acuta]|uniref:uncharacterized protein LOC131939008 isoform X2 n=1 Tax=Physella acuta TaxID=109671 RepID=UPI0027DC6348|nr:uncharacterized protein LOC131939008 isoform X2 [Physella acuta]
MYYPDFNGPQGEKLWKAGETIFPGLDFLRAHASMSSLPLTANGLDGTTALGLSLQGRDLSGSHLSPSKGSPPHNRASPRPGSASTTPTNLSAPPLSSGLNALNLIQTPKSGLKPSSYSSPPPMACNPEHNVCKLIDYRGAQVAAFIVESRELICLPQAFELFLKHLVGGLHTVYTKLKRLEITPVVCNVEQVRILRGLGAIQPGVNRCKLISCSEFDTLYDDCTNSNARPGRPPKRVHSTNPVDNDVLEKLKRRKLDIPGEYPYDQRFYERKPLMNGFPPVGYPAMPQFSNFFSMHHLMQPMAMASHIGLRPDSGVPKLERTTSDSGIISPRPRDERLPMLGMYGTPPGLDPRISHRPQDVESNKPLNLQVNGHHKDKESEASRSDDDFDDDKLSEDERQADEDLDDSYDSDEYHSSDAPDKPRPGSNGNPFASMNGESAMSEFESFVTKFNSVVRALVDAAKAVERRAAEEKDQISIELIKEKEKTQRLEREMQDERKKREFFQRRVRRLRRALKQEGFSESGSKHMEKPERSRSESSPEPVLRNSQEPPQQDSDSEKTLNTAHSSDLERKTGAGIFRQWTGRRLEEKCSNPTSTPTTHPPPLVPLSSPTIHSYPPMMSKSHPYTPSHQHLIETNSRFAHQDLVRYVSSGRSISH